MMEICEIIYKLLDDTYPVGMEDYVNDKHEDSIRKDLVEKIGTKNINEVREIQIETENEDVIHRDIYKNETEKYEYL